jgi:hypothetical protein
MKQSAYIMSSFSAGPKGLANAIMGNALRVYNGGSRGLGPAGKKIGAIYTQTLQAGYSKPGTVSHHPGGKKYWHSELKRNTKASLPGEPPAYQTGELADSVTYGSSRVPVRGPGGRFMRGFGKTVITVMSDSGYAAALEKGTSTVAPRPLWMPTRNNPRVGAMIRTWAKRLFVLAERAEAVKLRSGVPGMQMAREVWR